MNQKFIKPPAKSIVLKKLYKISIISIPESQQSLRLFEFNFFLPGHHSKKKSSNINIKKDKSIKPEVLSVYVILKEM